MDEEEEARKSLFGFGRKVRTRGDEELEKFDWVNGLGNAVKYGVPLATLLATSAQAKRLRNQAQVNLEVPQLQTGRVRALRRPNFALRRRDPAGSSLQENIAGQRFADAFMRDQELSFEAQDQQSRIGQENAIMDRTNQSAAMGADIRNRQAMIRSQISAQELLGNTLPLQQEALIGLYHNTQSDVAQYNFNNSMDDSAAVQAILTNPMSSEEDRKWARQRLGMDRKPRLTKRRRNAGTD